MDFPNFQKSNFDGGKFLKIWSSINLPWDHVMSHKKFGPDRFSRLDVYWIQTNKQTDKQTDRQAKFIYRFPAMLIVQNFADLYLKRNWQFTIFEEKVYEFWQTSK